jgi:kojibiose phosphorylase
VKHPVKSSRRALKNVIGQPWENVREPHCQAWQAEWERSDVLIEGDDEAQLAIRFNLYQLLIAAPRHAEHVNLGAKTLSGYGYR